VQAARVDQVRVDPAALQQAAAELTRLVGVVRSSRAGADGQVGALAARVGELQQPVVDQWREAGVALDRIEVDFQEMGRALSELATYFTELDRHAVRR
jgi:hypothetical protein